MYRDHQKSRRRIPNDFKPQNRDIQKRCLTVRGVPKEVSASDVFTVFGRFGTINKVDMKPHAAFVLFNDVKSCEEALKQKHVLNNIDLDVQRGTLFHPPNPLPLNQDVKPSQSTSPAVITLPEKPSLHTPQMLLKELETLTSFEEQMIKLKELLLAGDDHCEAVRQQVCNDIKAALETFFIVDEMYAFGSMITGLAFKNSDIDVYAKVHVASGSNLPLQQIIIMAKKGFYRVQKFTSIVPLRNAKTPILKAIHIPTKISCDTSFCNALGHWNSKLLHHYLLMNEKFFDLFVLIKYWAQVQDLVNTSKFSNYALFMMGVSFLQSLTNDDGVKIIPSVKDLQQYCDHSDIRFKIDCWYCGFDETLVKVTLPNTPQYSTIGLLYKFFTYVSTLPFESQVVSVLTGGLVPRASFGEKFEDLPAEFEPYKIYARLHRYNLPFKQEQQMVVHDPFKLSHNLTDRVSEKVKNQFMIACQVSANGCKAAMGEADLRRLIRGWPYKRDKQQSIPSTRTVTKDSKIIIEVAHPCLVVPDQEENQYELLEKFFKDVLLFDIIDVSEEDTSHKRAKLTPNSDVHSEKDSSQRSRVIIYTATHETWIGRNKARKALSIFGSPSFEDEVRISNYLLEKKAPPLALKFRCCFQKVNDSGKVCLHLEELDQPNNHGALNSLVNFLQGNLAKLLARFCKES